MAPLSQAACIVLDKSFLSVLRISTLTTQIAFIVLYLKSTSDAKKKNIKKCVNRFDWWELTFILVFSLFNMGYIFVDGAGDLSDARCLNPEDPTMLAFWNLCFPFYMLQWFMLFCLMFYRLQKIFRDTPFALSRCVIRTYWGLIVTLILLSVISGYFAAAGQVEIAMVFVPLYLIIIIALNVLLVQQFVSKLTAVCGDLEDQSNAHRLRATSTKAYILTLFSIISSVVSLTVIVAYYNSSDSDVTHYEYNIGLVLFGMFATLDMFTTFLSIFLHYTRFSVCYLCVFRRCDDCLQRQFVEKAQKQNMGTLKGLETELSTNTASMNTSQTTHTADISDGAVKYPTATLEPSTQTTVPSNTITDLSQTASP